MQFRAFDLQRDLAGGDGAVDVSYSTEHGRRGEALAAGERQLDEAIRDGRKPAARGLRSIE